MKSFVFCCFFNPTKCYFRRVCFVVELLSSLKRWSLLLKIGFSIFCLSVRKMTSEVFTQFKKHLPYQKYYENISICFTHILIRFRGTLNSVFHLAHAYFDDKARLKGACVFTNTECVKCCGRSNSLRHNYCWHVPKNCFVEFARGKLSLVEDYNMTRSNN